MSDSGLEEHQYISDVRSITVFLKYYIIYSNRDQYINPIENIFIQKIELGEECPG